jgi:ATP-dependent Clp protease ATP-binding subunit ClpA
MREEDGVGAQIVRKMGVTAERVREEVKAAAEASMELFTEEPRLTPQSKRVLELSAEEAIRLKHNYIGTEHLLLGLLRENDGVAANVLNKLGLDLETARKQVADYSGADAEQLQHNPPENAEPAKARTLPPHAYLPLVESLALTLDAAIAAISENDADRLYVAQRTLTALRDELRRSAQQPGETPKS